MKLCNLNPQSSELSEHINLFKWFEIKNPKFFYADFEEEMKAELKKVNDTTFRASTQHSYI